MPSVKSCHLRARSIALNITFSKSKNMKKCSLVLLLVVAIASCNNTTNESDLPSHDSAIKKSATPGAVIDGNMRGNSNAAGDTVMSPGAATDTATLRKMPAGRADKHGDFK